MLLLALASLAHAAPAGFKQTRTTDLCTIYTGPASSAGVVPLMAECTWRDVALDKIDRIFSPWQDHDLFFSAIAASDVERTEGGFAYVRQIHQARGISDRECLLKMQRSAAGGGLKFSWELAPASAASDGRVPVAHDVGYWQFSPSADGSVSVVYYLEYGPGGSVPGFMVRAFQGGGFEAATDELHAWLVAH